MKFIDEPQTFNFKKIRILGLWSVKEEEQYETKIIPETTSFWCHVQCPGNNKRKTMNASLWPRFLLLSCVETWTGSSIHLWSGLTHGSWSLSFHLYDLLFFLLSVYYIFLSFIYLSSFQHLSFLSFFFLFVGCWKVC